MNLVTPSGWLKRPAMLMSRNWMDQVWSWDNLFNAAAIAVAHPGLAEDQWRVIFDLQDEHGALPDAVSDTWLHYNFSKPPVQGLLYRWMELQRSGFWNAERKEWFYRHTAAFTDWWLENRRFAGRGLCHYLHGNDSGWDNTTLLREGAPIESPDLNAFLIVQCQLLAQLAQDPRDGERWQQEADGLTAALLAELWDGEAFVGRLPLKDDMAVRADSLVACMPLVLGDALPAQVRTALLQQVQRLLTPYGPATEAPESPFYIPDGYWRGPIWGPSTQILVHALHVSGETTLARDVASRFLRLCEKSGFAENFDALSGAPLRDLNYTWTASAFLELAAYVAAPDWQDLTPIA
jgi:glycogen debranching enzyme